MDQIAAPVDDDKGGALLTKAIEEHKGNRSVFDAVSPLEFRDSRDPLTKTLPNLEWGPAGHLQDINDSGIPVYLWGGWFDGFTRDGFLMFRNFTAPRRFTIGAWSHSPKDPAILKEEFALLACEEMRWFDYWLKGIDNGVQKEAPITYQVMVAPGKNVWKTASQWPLPAAADTFLYFQDGRTGNVASVNDGRLTTISGCLFTEAIKPMSPRRPCPRRPRSRSIGTSSIGRRSSCPSRGAGSRSPESGRRPSF